MNPLLPISFISSFLVINLFSSSSSTTLAKPLPPLAIPQPNFSELNSFSSPNNDIDFLLLPKQRQRQPQEAEDEGQQQLSPLGTNTNSDPLLLDLPLISENNQPNPASYSSHCNSLRLHPRSTEDSPTIITTTTTTTTATTAAEPDEPDMCPINTQEVPFPSPDWDQEWKDYVRKYPPEEGELVLPEEGPAENRAFKDESVGTGCPDPFHQDHLCCAGPPGKTGVFSIRPDDVSFVQHCAVCM